MRFKLHHLFVVVAIVAIGLFLIDQYVYDTASVVFSSSIALGKPTTLALIPSDADYDVCFTIHNGPNSVDGMGFSKYGYNRLLATDVTESNVSQIFKGRTVKMKFRSRSLPWLPATQVSSELDKYFISVLIFPNAEEWQTDDVRR